MRALLQRVTDASVTVKGEIVGEIGPGLLILVCAMPGDDVAAVQKLAQKITKLRIFKDDEGKMNLSLAQTGGEALVVSQFTLAADTKRGNRPGFSSALRTPEAETLYLQFAHAMKNLNVSTKTGRFGADMSVALTNDGPVTIWIDTEDK